MVEAQAGSLKPGVPLLTDARKWTIVGLLSASITINLLHRQVLSVLASELRSQFHWTNAQYGYIAVAFNLGMMLGQIPAGQLMDKVGTRKGLLTHKRRRQQLSHRKTCGCAMNNLQTCRDRNPCLFVHMVCF